MRYRTEQNGLVNFDININSEVPRYQQLVNAINDALANNTLSSGDALPSVNAICNDYKLSRDTVFKAYTILKENGVVESVPNKGYYVANDTTKVLLVLDTFKAYKEVLYHAFVNNLPKKVIVDVQFHHYNINNFKTILNNSKGKYFKYVVMPFDHKEVPHVLQDIDNDKLLLIDWNIHSKPSNNYIFQDFGSSFYEALEQAIVPFRKYKKLVFVYPAFTKHPLESVTFFKQFCEVYKFKYKIITDSTVFNVVKGEAYISVSDRVLGAFLEACKKDHLEPGIDVEFLHRSFVI